MSTADRAEAPGAQGSATAEAEGAAGGGKQSDSAVRSLSPTSLIAGGAAAATASVVGGHLGVAGTVVGAALTSVVSAGAVALYTDSVRRSTATLKAVQRVTARRDARRNGRSRTGRDAAAGVGAGEETLNEEGALADGIRPTGDLAEVQIDAGRGTEAALQLEQVIEPLVALRARPELDRARALIERAVTAGAPEP